MIVSRPGLFRGTPLPSTQTTPLNRHQTVFRIILLALAAMLSGAAPAAAEADRVALTRLDDRVRIEIGGKLFTEYLFLSGTKPCLYPVLNEQGTSYTRDWPLREDTKDDRDHDWHRSIWFGHGLVNGHDFWRSVPGAGRIVHEGVLEQRDGETGLLRVGHRWEAADGKPVCSDVTTLRFRKVPEGYFIDHEIEIRASHGPLVLGDTEEGALAVRVNEALRVTHGRGKQARPGTGRILNAAGDRDSKAWGKRAPWCDYSGPVNGAIIGVAIFDHPSNPSHPTWWHVREYGLFAANPFGKHDFENLKDRPDAGAITVPAGGKLVLRHRIFLHRGDEKTARVAEHYSEFASGK